MPNRRSHSLPAVGQHKVKRSRCLTAICFSWKMITCLVSHVTLVLLVVSYCVGGAYLFQHLERPHDIEVKRNIHNMRINLTNKIWKFSDNASVLRESDWIANMKKELSAFEKQILAAMKTDGWDGDEDLTKSQWTFAGSLFYSIIVVTTIGYGHISPRTDWGKVNTIFYAIIGIPLMLLCLSNLGDVMASSFRFVYWRICCFFCTRPTKKMSVNSRQRSLRNSRILTKYQIQTPGDTINIVQPFHNDFHVKNSSDLPHAHSDSELPTIRHKERRNDMNFKYIHKKNMKYRTGSRENSLDASSFVKSLQNDRTADRSNFRNHHLKEFEAPPRLKNRALSVHSAKSPSKRSHHLINEQSRILSATQERGASMPNPSRALSKSIDRSAIFTNIDEDVIRKTPIIFNKYAIDSLLGSSEMPNNKRQEPKFRSQSLPRYPRNRDALSKNQIKYLPNMQTTCCRDAMRPGDQFELPVSYCNRPEKRDLSIKSYTWMDEGERCITCSHENNFIKSLKNNDRKKCHLDRLERLPPSPRIMSPMGFAVQRQIRRKLSYDYDNDSIVANDFSDMQFFPKDRPVPIWLCVFLVISYILGGAALFAFWEKWSFLDSAYFCFITLTTIGFGDFVPAKGVKDESQQSIAYCSLYLLFGIALLAMSFNLVQEEFIANVKEVARSLGILKDDEIEV